MLRGKTSIFRFKKINILLWIMWYIWTFILFDIILTSSLWDGCSVYRYYMFIMPLLSVIATNNKLVEEILDRYNNQIQRKVYLYNFICMGVGFLFVVSDYDTVETMLLINETVAAVYWILSIPLIVVYDLKWWLIGAATISISTMLYLEFLTKLAQKLESWSLSYALCTMGVVLVCTVISMLVFRYRMNEIRCEMIE